MENTFTTSEYAVFPFLVSEIAKAPNTHKRLECVILNSEEFQTLFRNAWKERVILYIK